MSSSFPFIIPLSWKLDVEIHLDSAISIIDYNIHKRGQVFLIRIHFCYSLHKTALFRCTPHHESYFVD